MVLEETFSPENWGASQCVSPELSYERSLITSQFASVGSSQPFHLLSFTPSSHPRCLHPQSTLIAIIKCPSLLGAVIDLMVRQRASLVSLNKYTSFHEAEAVSVFECTVIHQIMPFLLYPLKSFVRLHYLSS